MPILILLLCLASTWYLAGVIVMIQFVHYPLWARVGEDEFTRYHAEHARRITPVVLPAMMIELATSAWLVFAPSPGSGRLLAGVGFAAALATWLITVLFALPLQARLGRGFDARALARLMRTNGMRTAAWLVHAAVVLDMTRAALTR